MWLVLEGEVRKEELKRAIELQTSARPYGEQDWQSQNLVPPVFADYKRWHLLNILWNMIYIL